MIGLADKCALKGYYKCIQELKGKKNSKRRKMEIIRKNQMKM